MSTSTCLAALLCLLALASANSSLLTNPNITNFRSGTFNILPAFSGDTALTRNYSIPLREATTFLTPIPIATFTDMSIDIKTNPSVVFYLMAKMSGTSTVVLNVTANFTCFSKLKVSYIIFSISITDQSNFIYMIWPNYPNKNLTSSISYVYPNGFQVNTTGKFVYANFIYSANVRAYGNQLSLASYLKIDPACKCIS